MWGLDDIPVDPALMHLASASSSSNRIIRNTVASPGSATQNPANTGSAGDAPSSIRPGALPPRSANHAMSNGGLLIDPALIQLLHPATTARPPQGTRQHVNAVDNPIYGSHNEHAQVSAGDAGDGEGGGHGHVDDDPDGQGEDGAGEMDVDGDINPALREIVNSLTKAQEAQLQQRWARSADIQDHQRGPDFHEDHLSSAERDASNIIQLQGGTTSDMPLSDEHEHPHELHGHMEEEPLRLEDLTPEHFNALFQRAAEAYDHTSPDADLDIHHTPGHGHTPERSVEQQEIQATNGTVIGVGVGVGLGVGVGIGIGVGVGVGVGGSGPGPSSSRYQMRHVPSSGMSVGVGVDLEAEGEGEGEGEADVHAVDGQFAHTDIDAPTLPEEEDNGIYDTADAYYPTIDSDTAGPSTSLAVPLPLPLDIAIEGSTSSSALSSPVPDHLSPVNEADIAQPAKRGRGRPRGSKNKPRLFPNPLRPIGKVKAGQKSLDALVQLDPSLLSFGQDGSAILNAGESAHGLDHDHDHDHHHQQQHHRHQQSQDRHHHHQPQPQVPHVPKPRGRPPKVRQGKDLERWLARKAAREGGEKRGRGRPRKFPGYLVREMRLSKNREEFIRLVQGAEAGEGGAGMGGGEGEGEGVGPGAGVRMGEEGDEGDEGMGDVGGQEEGMEGDEGVDHGARAESQVKRRGYAQGAGTSAFPQAAEEDSRGRKKRRVETLAQHTEWI